MKQAKRKARRTRAVREDIRERLLGAALLEFAAKGFAGASTRAIAQRIGAHQPQINYHFESKEALWTAAVDHLFAALAHAMRGLGPARVLRGSGEVTEIAAAFAEMIRRFVRFAAAHPELNQIMVHEATAESGRLMWMTERHVKPLYDTVRRLWRRLREAGIAAPIDDRLFHYVMVGAASIVYVNAAEARLLTGIEPTAHRWVEIHAEGLVTMLLPNAPRAHAINPLGAADRRAASRPHKVVSSMEERRPTHENQVTGTRRAAGVKPRSSRALLRRRAGAARLRPHGRGRSQDDVLHPRQPS